MLRIVEGAGAAKAAGVDKGELGRWGGGGEGEIKELGGKGECADWGMREVASQDSGADRVSSMVVSGRRLEGRESRCSINVTWNELKIFPVVTSQRR